MTVASPTYSASLSRRCVADTARYIYTSFIPEHFELTQRTTHQPRRTAILSKSSDSSIHGIICQILVQPLPLPLPDGGSFNTIRLIKIEKPISIICAIFATVTTLGAVFYWNRCLSRTIAIAARPIPARIICNRFRVWFFLFCFVSLSSGMNPWTDSAM